MSSQIRDIQQGSYGIEGVFWFSLFDKDVSVSIDRGGTIEFAERCVALANSLSDHVVDHLCKASIRYCKEYLDAIGEPTKDFETPRDVLQIIYPSVLIVPAWPLDDDPVLHMELNCEWEEEHGMEWIVRKNSVLYVGPFNGHNPKGECSRNKPWNHA